MRDRFACHSPQASRNSWFAFPGKFLQTSVVLLFSTVVSCFKLTVSITCRRKTECLAKNEASFFFADPVFPAFFTSMFSFSQTLNGKRRDDVAEINFKIINLGSACEKHASPCKETHASENNLYMFYHIMSLTHANCHKMQTMCELKLQRLLPCLQSEWSVPKRNLTLLRFHTTPQSRKKTMLQTTCMFDQPTGCFI